MSKREKVTSHTQGMMDGLCGVYALTHALLHFRGTDSDNIRARYFNRLLKAIIEQPGFEASKIRKGFNRKALKKALDQVIEREGLQIELYDLPHFAKKRGAVGVLDTFEYLEVGESILLFLHDPLHWICAYRASSGKIKCFDSSPEKAIRIKCLDEDAINDREISLASGLVILRRTNAQTH